jgi:hypothetical protein
VHCRLRDRAQLGATRQSGAELVRRVGADLRTTRQADLAEQGRKRGVHRLERGEVAVSLGKTEYAPEVAKLIKQTGAKVVFLLVIGGKRGGAVSAECPLALMPHLAENLRAIADQVEADYEEHTRGMES